MIVNEEKRLEQSLRRHRQAVEKLFTQVLGWARKRAWRGWGRW
jgi:hypothetical protein